jgi:hypothetical protein
MSNNLPVPRNELSPETLQRNDQAGRSIPLSDWISSPLGRAVAQALPEVIRLASRRQPPEVRPLASRILPSSDGASGMTLSEVEVDIDAPFIRRLTIRSASSWSVSPEVILAEQRQQRRARWKLRALTAGLLGIAGMALALRSGISLPDRLNPGASLPSLSSNSSAASSAKKTPGLAD